MSKKSAERTPVQGIQAANIQRFRTGAIIEAKQGVAPKNFRRPRLYQLRKGFMDRDDRDDVAFDSAEAIVEMRKRQAELGLLMQRIGAQGLAELRERGELTAEECAELLAEGLKLEGAAAPGDSSMRH